MRSSKIIVNDHEIIVDDVDLPLLRSRTWRVYIDGNKRYLKWVACANYVQSIVAFHRVITNASTGEIVDHINGNGLDNRRSNLRIVSAANNSRNRVKQTDGETTSRFKGVSLSKGMWRSRIRVDKKLIGLGTYKNEVEAAYAYDLASLKMHGDFGLRNFLPLV